MDKLAFARLVNLLSHWGMRELDSHEMLELSNRTTPVKPFGEYIDNTLIDELLKALRDGKFIEAIKAHRALTGYGLKESKDFIEQYRHKSD